MNQRVSARHFRRFQCDRVGGGSSERTTALDRMAFTIGRFQPGTLLLGRVHTETFYQKSWWTQSVSFGGASSCEPARIRRGVAGVPPPGLGFLLILMMYTLSR